ncbi:alpha/beta fold hydrolase [Leptolyngbya sp. FACHB-36]|uniref:alpha/beta fold hydrolase n=1 Tax=Leptolyngbya sp. FACHB-36 TaxID=2692808 RepID=UPI00168095DF|nr:alpha/beta fold hydrolase [Leptolyngbya sp. FACHB-36]MBD2020555.1 alpha/beta fold hydrolase [Leptolyngbya sp. FACHB-36]
MKQPVTEATVTIPWRQRVGNQRDWVWRGWQTRYTYLRSLQPDSSTPLILLHGFGASIGHWRHNLTELAQNHTVYALDLLGFGASEKAVAPYGTPFWAEQVYEFWRTFIGQPVVLVGNSIGSVVCLTVAARYPEMVKGLVLINLPDSSVLESPVWVQRTIAAVAVGAQPVIGLAKRVFTSPLVFNPLFRVIRSAPFVRLWAKQAYSNSEALTEELLEILSGPAFDRGASAALRAMVAAKAKPGADYRAKTILPQLQVPMLLLWGQEDRMVPPKLARLFVRCNPNLTLVEIEKAGHCPHDECPEQVNRIVLDWLAELETARETQLLQGSGNVPR